VFSIRPRGRLRSEMLPRARLGELPSPEFGVSLLGLGEPSKTAGELGVALRVFHRLVNGGAIQLLPGCSPGSGVRAELSPATLADWEGCSAAVTYKASRIDAASSAAVKPGLAWAERAANQEPQSLFLSRVDPTTARCCNSRKAEAGRSPPHGIERLSPTNREKAMQPPATGIGTSARVDLT
jgi:hypothetical protein